MSLHCSFRILSRLGTKNTPRFVRDAGPMSHRQCTLPGIREGLMNLVDGP